MTLYLFYSWVWNSNLWSSQQTLLRTVSFRSCAEARRIGVTPLYRGFAGYQAALDADKDGIACEPYPF
ncbi:excalibur calcium-binding domain-containing protein [Microvirga sp. P5_D2]